MFLLRNGNTTVTDVCMAVGFSSLGTFSRVFTAVVGEPPSVYRRRGVLAPVPTCFAMAWLRPGPDTAESEKPGGPSEP
jgi:AraC-like DNA-binding protein